MLEQKREITDSEGLHGKDRIFPEGKIKSIRILFCAAGDFDFFVKIKLNEKCAH